MKAEWRDQLEGWWLLALWLAISSVTAFSLPFSNFLGDQVGLLPQTNPGLDPPLYFLGRDFLAGMAAVTTALITVPLAWIYWRKYPQYSRMIVWFTVLWLASKILVALDIGLRCRALFDRSEGCTWKTFDEHLYSPFHQSISIICLVLGVALAKWLYRSDRTNQGNGAARPPAS